MLNLYNDSDLEVTSQDFTGDFVLYRMQLSYFSSEKDPSLVASHIPKILFYQNFVKWYVQIKGKVILGTYIFIMSSYTCLLIDRRSLSIFLKI